MVILINTSVTGPSCRSVVPHSAHIMLWKGPGEVSYLHYTGEKWHSPSDIIHPSIHPFTHPSTHLELDTFGTSDCPERLELQCSDFLWLLLCEITSPKPVACKSLQDHHPKLSKHGAEALFASDLLFDLSQIIVSWLLVSAVRLALTLNATFVFSRIFLPFSWQITYSQRYTSTRQSDQLHFSSQHHV